MCILWVSWRNLPLTGPASPWCCASRWDCLWIRRSRDSFVDLQVHYVLSVVRFLVMVSSRIWIIYLCTWLSCYRHLLLCLDQRWEKRATKWILHLQCQFWLVAVCLPLRHSRSVWRMSRSCSWQETRLLLADSLDNAFVNDARFLAAIASITVLIQMVLAILAWIATTHLQSRHVVAFILENLVMLL